MTQQPTIIAGGGIAGLAAALALGQRDGLILERTAVFEEMGAGLQLGPNAVRALQRLGAWDAVASVTSQPTEIHMRDGVSGRLLTRLQLGRAFEKRFGTPYNVAHRADLHKAMLEVVHQQPNIGLENDFAVSDCRGSGDVVTVYSDDQQFLGGALLAADGVNSAIRQILVPDSGPINSGAVFHRALVGLPPAIAGVALDCVNLWLFPGGHLVHYLVGKDKKLNIVAVTPEGQSPSQFFANACDELRQVVNLIGSASPWPGLYVSPLPRWNFDKILLLGDAAHGTLPYLAQGAAMALEDAASLQTLLHAQLPMRKVFGALNAMRIQRTSKLHRASLAAGQRYHATGILRHMQNATMRYLPEHIMFSQLRWIYAWSIAAS